MAASSAAQDGRPIFVKLLPVLAAVFVTGIMTGCAIPVIPIYIHRDLGLGTLVVGFVTGAQFATSVVCRIWAGHYADRRGAKRAIIKGCMTCVAAGAIYLLSLAFVGAPVIAAGILVVARVLHGLSESFVVTGSIAWGFSRLGHGAAGSIIAWVGNATFASTAIGAIIGTALFDFGFVAIAWTITLTPLPLLLALRKMPLAASSARTVTNFRTIAGTALLPGLGMAFAAVGYGAILTFSALLFADRGWQPIWLPYSAFAASMIVTRICLGHLPDKLGGARIALLSLPMECAGLLLIWLAHSAETAALGAVVTALGYTLVFPGFGREAIAGAPLESRGLAMGMYTAFPLLSLGITGPLLGLLAESADIAAVFAASAVAVICGTGFAARLLLKPPL